MMHAGRETYRHLAEYNRRANGELYAAVAALTDRARKRDDRTWFGSLQGLLNHALVGDMMWLRRFTPIHPASKVLADPRLAPEDLAWNRLLREDFEEMRGERAYVDDRIIDWFDECPEERYDTLFEYLDSAGNVRHARADRAQGIPADAGHF